MKQSRHVRAASDVDYESTYMNYYGHTNNASSFDISLASMIKKKSADFEVGDLPILDIGGGNGLLSSLFVELGIKSTFIDVNPSLDGIKLDLSVEHGVGLEAISNHISKRLNSTRWFATCLDVIEHISLRDMSSFLKNLNSLTTDSLLISISTRPSSDGNRYHPSVLPIETWLRLLDAAGLSCIDKNYINLKGITDFSGIDDKISTVAYWCRKNIFNDSNGHQHYLLLKKNGQPDPKKLDALINSIIMPQALDENRIPLKIIYTVNFIQDWHFLRELMDLLRRDELLVIFNRDNISKVNLNVIRNVVSRCGIKHSYLDDVILDIDDFLASLTSKHLFISATEGPITKRHLATLPLLSAASCAGHVTVSLQHGVFYPEEILLSSTNFFAWSERFQTALSKRCCSDISYDFYDAGLIKPSVVYKKSKFDFIALRFGERYLKYEKKVLVTSNLHWDAHSFIPADFIAWLKNEASSNSDVLFIWRPHPREYSIYLVSDLPENILIVEQIITDVLDISVCEILKNVDACITTLSTIAFDAVRLGTSIAILPFDSDIGRDISLSPEIMEKACFISDMKTFDVRDFILSSSRNKTQGEMDNEMVENKFIAALINLYSSEVKKHSTNEFCILMQRYATSLPPLDVDMSVAVWQEKYCLGE
ncbi:hypothetical protein [Aeromonas dhakensis]|uniref:hypothetical protein n=1 Tax=Aeromonas dhakensis TaxID=196024 RepID=UPI00357129EA